MSENSNLKNKEFTEKFHLTWKNINYSISIKDEKKQQYDKEILSNITGTTSSQSVYAIMGPSGCGKSSLLNFLNDRIDFKRGTKHSGEIYINRENTAENNLKITNYSSYVMQDDVLFDILTPKETFNFVCKLKDNLTQEEMDKKIDTLLDDLQLKKCQNTFIGSQSKKGISGGERKRTSIGVEILSNPSILFLDEPTSGLDSQTSFTIISYLGELARRENKAVIFTIHQPSSNIYGLFDKLLIMNKGKMVYQGLPTGVVDYFGNGVLNLPLEGKANPADAFMHTIEEFNHIQTSLKKSKGNNNKNNEENKFLGNESEREFISKEEKELKKLRLEIMSNENGIYSKYQEICGNHIEKDIDSILKNNSLAKDIPQKNLQGSGFCKGFIALAKRALLNMIRNPMVLKLRLVTVLIFSFIACSIFWNMQYDQKGLQNRAGFLFFFTINNFMSIIFGTVLSFPLERGVFLREHANKLYGVFPYFLSKNLIESPIGLLVTFLYGAIVYFLVNMRPGAEHYFIFLLNFVCLAYLAQSIGFVFGTGFSDLNTALIITQFSVLPSFLFSGFLINQKNMPVWLSWIRFISPFRYALEGGMSNEFDGNPLIPDSANLRKLLNLDIGMWNCMIIMVCFGTALRILAYFLLKLLVKRVG
jgi:ABC-type multidrug transport system ATPase subunit